MILPQHALSGPCPSFVMKRRSLLRWTDVRFRVRRGNLQLGGNVGLAGPPSVLCISEWTMLDYGRFGRASSRDPTGHNEEESSFATDHLRRKTSAMSPCAAGGG